MHGNDRRALQEAMLKDRQFIALNISATLSALERELDTLKWFDYRFLSPMNATERFVKDYQTIFRRKWGSNFSTEEAAKKIGIRRNNWRSNTREFTSFWRARQFADSLGMPYPFFIDHALEFLFRRGWTRPARPNQLYSSKHAQLIADHVIDRWTEQRTDAEFTFSRLPHYHSENFRGYPAQLDHRKWVVEQIKLRHGSIDKIANACLEDQVLPLEMAREAFGDHQMERMFDQQACAALTKVPVAEVEAGSFYPSCFQVLHACNSADPKCGKCAFKRACALGTNIIHRRLVEQCGNDDPVLAKKRLCGAERTRRHRAARKAAQQPLNGRSTRHSASTTAKAYARK